jgi:methionine sulfoxide reductase heme-binding subunit
MKYQRLWKVIVFLACLAPLFALAWKAFNDQLGANPIEVITHSTGKWTLGLLLITLSITPLRKLSAVPWLIKFRRMIGLFAFFYACLHLTTYVWLDKFFDVHEMVKDIEKRKFITIGFAAFCGLVPLAVTSTAGWIRRLGGKRWQALHRLIYFSALAGVVHFTWAVKKDLTQPIQFGIVLAVLLAYRVFFWLKPKTIEKSAPMRSAATEARSA